MFQSCAKASIANFRIGSDKEPKKIKLIGFNIKKLCFWLLSQISSVRFQESFAKVAKVWISSAFHLASSRKFAPHFLKTHVKGETCGRQQQRDPLFVQLYGIIKITRWQVSFEQPMLLKIGLNALRCFFMTVNQFLHSRKTQLDTFKHNFSILKVSNETNKWNCEILWASRKFRMIIN